MLDALTFILALIVFISVFEIAPILGFLLFFAGAFENKFWKIILGAFLIVLPIFYIVQYMLVE